MSEKLTSETMNRSDEGITEEEAETLVEADERFISNDNDSIGKSPEAEDFKKSLESVEVVEATIVGISNIEEDGVTLEFEVEDEVFLITFKENGNPSISDFFSVVKADSFSDAYQSSVNVWLDPNGEPKLESLFSRSENWGIKTLKKFCILLFRYKFLLRAFDERKEDGSETGRFVGSLRGVGILLCLCASAVPLMGISLSVGGIVGFSLFFILACVFALSFSLTISSGFDLSPIDY